MGFCHVVQRPTVPSRVGFSGIRIIRNSWRCAAEPCIFLLQGGHLQVSWRLVPQGTQSWTTSLHGNVHISYHSQLRGWSSRTSAQTGQSGQKYQKPAKASTARAKAHCLGWSGLPGKQNEAPMHLVQLLVLSTNSSLLGNNTCQWQAVRTILFECQISP